MDQHLSRQKIWKRKKNKNGKAILIDVDVGLAISEFQKEWWKEKAVKNNDWSRECSNIREKAEN